MTYALLACAVAVLIEELRLASARSKVRSLEARLSKAEEIGAMALDSAARLESVIVSLKVDMVRLERELDACDDPIATLARVRRVLSFGNDPADMPTRSSANPSPGRGL